MEATGSGGRTVRNEAFRGNELQFSRSDLAPGLYLLEVWDGNRRLGTAKVAVLRY